MTNNHRVMMVGGAATPRTSVVVLGSPMYAWTTPETVPPTPPTTPPKPSRMDAAQRACEPVEDEGEAGLGCERQGC